MTKKYLLLGFIPKRRGGILFGLGVLLLATAAADQFYFHLFGSLTIFAWGFGGLLVFISILLRLLSTSARSAYLQIERDGIIVAYGGYELPIIYESIDVITGGRISQHHSLKEFGRQERKAVEPYFNQTQIFISLRQETEELQEAKQHLPSFMFGTTQIGLLLLVDGDNWLTVERAIDAARVEWLQQVKNSQQEAYQTPVAKLWGQNNDFEDDDAEA